MSTEGWIWALPATRLFNSFFGMYSLRVAALESSRVEELRNLIGFGQTMHFVANQNVLMKILALRRGVEFDRTNL